MEPLRVLVACEYSGTVRDAFIRAGHDALSCDLEPTQVPGPHHHGDVMDIIDWGWDLAIMHPPCTYLTNAGVRWLSTEQGRWKELIDGAVFFREMLNAPIPHIAVENPIMHKYAAKIIGARQTQVVQPWEFGHPETKGVGLWLKNPPPLAGTNNVREHMLTLPMKERSRVHYASPGADRWKVRSLFFEGIANAMADQWGGYVLAQKEQAA